MCCTAVVSEAAQVVLVLRSQGTSWQFQEAEAITINGKDNLRSGWSQSLQLSADQYKRLPQSKILGAGLLRKHAGGYLVTKSGGAWNPVAPDGASVKGSVTYADLWASAKITVRKDRNSKSAIAVEAGDLFAVLPGGNPTEAIASFLGDQSNFQGVGEKNEAAGFEEWSSLFIAVAPALTGAPGEKLQQLLLLKMQSTNQALATGIAHYSDLLDGLKYVEVSGKAYPKDDRQEKARAALVALKAGLDQRAAILRAFGAGELWDAFLDKYALFDKYSDKDLDFARWDNSFDDVREMREKAFTESKNQHLAEGKRLDDEKNYTLALKELELAQLRSPRDKEIGDLIENVRLEEARHNSAAEDARSKSAGTKKPPEDRNSPRQTQLRAHLLYADNYIRDKQFDEAENEINQAAVLDSESPAILLSRAKLAQGRQQLLEAIKILNLYDRRVTASEDLDQGLVLRTSVNFELRKTRQTLKDAIAKAKAGGDYVQASKSAEEGLALDGTDLDFLLEAGLGRAIAREPARAEELLNKYLQLSQAPGSDAKQRAEVYDLLPKLKETRREPVGPPNWYSGYKSPPGVFYCPISLMFNKPVAEVRASHGQSVSFEWNNNELLKVRVVNQQPSGQKDRVVYFDYFPGRTAVRRVSTEGLDDPKQAAAVPKFTDKGPVVEGAKGAFVALLNYPAVDPLMVENLTGKRVAAVVVGNPYFHPFVWEGTYTFLLEYDDRGRVKSATQVGGGQGGAHVFDLTWDGAHDLWLIKIAERGTGDYQRTMTYAGGKLVREDISYHGRTSKIEYKYSGDQLIEADCGEDPSLSPVDAQGLVRSRRVKFR
jgi:hypothetical protein